MSRYTDYDAIDYKNYNMIGESQEFMRGVVYVAERIEEAPSIDICFCRECKYYLPMQKNLPYAVRKRYCNKGAIKATSPDDFCSYGSRSEKPNNSMERSSE